MIKACKVIRSGAAFRGRQGLDYFAGVSAETAGSEGICMHLLAMPPGTVAKAHYHETHETAIFMLEGVIELAQGPNLDRGQAGDFVYIPAGVPHRPDNRVAKTTPGGSPRGLRRLGAVK